MIFYSVIFLHSTETVTNKYKNGNIKEIIAIDLEGRKSGDYKLFYSNGKVKEKGDFRRNKKTGMWYYYYENGKRKIIEIYTGNHLIQFEQFNKEGKSHGEYSRYNNDGTLYRQGFYKNGERTGTWKVFNKNGEVESSHSYGGEEIKKKVNLRLKVAETQSQISQNNISTARNNIANINSRLNDLGTWHKTWGIIGTIGSAGAIVSSVILLGISIANNNTVSLPFAIGGIVSGGVMLGFSLWELRIGMSLSF